MPFAQFGYPHQGRDEFESSFPADYICEAVDQTRGWFYTLMAVGTLVFDQSSYRNVLCLGHILDKDGRKMSKHLGNVLEPMALMERHGADAVRWFMLASGSPLASRRLSHEAIQEVVRKTLLTYWNTVAFQSLYARLADWSPAATAPPVAARPVLDRWVASQSQVVTREVTEALEDFDTQRAGRALATFVDDLSNWYVRRSRRRFWRGDPAALATLHEALERVTLLMAPFTPFLTERVWQDLVRPDHPTAPSSVHLATWPEPDASLVDAGLADQVGLVRRLVELGRAARAGSGVKTRQPLARALVSAPGWADLPADLRGELADELNVQQVDELSTAEGDLVEVVVKASFRSLGKRFGPRTPLVADAVSRADARAVADALRQSGQAEVVVEGAAVRLGRDDVVVTETPKEGWAVSDSAGESMALDLRLTPALRRLGLARDVVRLLQEARKGAGLEVSDRIELWWSAAGEVAEAIEENQATIAEEVLAVRVVRGEGEPELVAVEDPALGLRFSLRRVVPTP
jgi:isoleucyl-tRNA synthetase